ncbi:MAG: UpxY family transcription antiterminator [Planctomycetota bacterium]|jgi:transcription antitermination factor NusG
MKQWYAVYTRSRHEKDVAGEFANSEIDHYLPLYRRERRWKDRKKMVEFPMFPGYLFVKANIEGEDGWERKKGILSPKGVVKILCDPAGAPIPVPDQEVLNIRTVLEKNLEVDPYQYEFRPGQFLRIRKGPLSGVEGELIRRRGVHKLILRVELLSQAVSVTLSAADVEAMS